MAEDFSSSSVATPDMVAAVFAAALEQVEPPASLPAPSLPGKRQKRCRDGSGFSCRPSSLTCCTDSEKQAFALGRAGKLSTTLTSKDAERHARHALIPASSKESDSATHLGLEGLLHCRGRRYRNSMLKVLLHAWLRAVASSASGQGPRVTGDSKFLTFQVPVQSAAWNAWRRATAAAALQRRQDALDTVLNTNLELVQDCQEIAVKVALQRLVAAAAC
ncbi:unnamed protein product [Symbiodinium natans]|uniref:Uncharacterized protein n=1 Tax=Symbiodinium natans TaxID=878477 RepID=A0A812V4G2_9DINO|nr:unnamed protein product [Symbiodinium natans]